MLLPYSKQDKPGEKVASVLRCGEGWQALLGWTSAGWDSRLIGIELTCVFPPLIGWLLLHMQAQKHAGESEAAGQTTPLRFADAPFSDSQ